MNLFSKPFSPLKRTPLLESYFTRLPLSKTQPSMLASRVVNNGWIWNADPMVDFAAKESKAYLLCDVIVWGDCVKLRYGAQPVPFSFFASPFFCLKGFVVRKLKRGENG